MPSNLTSSLEDYLETIYLLQKGVDQEARVRDIAAARSVKASSVSPALKRLSEMGYLEYEQRESIRLTEAGKAAARRVYARHVLLFQFFHDILGMPEDKAREEACGLEHALSDEGMDRFVHFFESRSMCDCSQCQQVDRTCSAMCSPGHACDRCQHQEIKTLAQIEDHKTVKVLKISAKGAVRKSILDMGILPNVDVTRECTCAEFIAIRVAGHELRLTEEQAGSVIVV